MYKFFECENYNKIFWNNETENKPDLVYMASLSWKEITTQFDYVSQFDTKINYPTDWYYTNRPNYFKVETGKFTRYYFVTSTGNENLETITLNLTLDVWATYTLPALKANAEQPIDIVRSHLKNELAYQLNDSLLDTVPITYKENFISRNYYEYTERGSQYVYLINPSGIYSNEELLVDKDDITNANIYYVFKGLNQKENESDYYFIPVLSKDKSQLYRRGKPSSEAVLYSFDITSDNDLANANDSFQQAITDYGKENLLITYTNEKIPVNTEPNQLRIEYRYTQTCQSISTTTSRACRSVLSDIYLNSNLIDTKGFGGCMTYDKIYCDVYPEAIPGIVTKLDIILKDGVAYENININNYLSNVNALINNPNLNNLFIGKYIGPNFLCLYKNIEVINNSDLNSILVFKMGVNGTYINNLNLYDFPLINAPDFYNSKEINNRILLNYFKINYLNANFPIWNYFLNSQNDIVINGLFLFNGAPSIIADNFYLSTVDSILTLPYQIPSAQDEYILYYSTVMSQINTGLEQAKVNAAMGITNSIIGGTMGAISGFGGASIAKDKGNSPFGGILSGIGSIIGGGMNAAQSAISLAQYRDNVNAKFADIKRISGASFAPSNVKDASTLLYSVNDDKYNETIEILKPSDDTLKLLNNVLYLYGNITPFNVKVKDCFPRYNFNYLQINQSWLNTNLGTWLAGQPTNIIDTVAASLANGVRVWRVFPNYDVEN